MTLAESSALIAERGLRLNVGVEGLMTGCIQVYEHPDGYHARGRGEPSLGWVFEGLADGRVSLRMVPLANVNGRCCVVD